MYQSHGKSWRIDERESHSLSILLYLRAVAGIRRPDDELPDLIDPLRRSTKLKLSSHGPTAWTAWWNTCAVSDQLDVEPGSIGEWLSAQTPDRSMRELLSSHFEDATRWRSGRQAQELAALADDSSAREIARERRGFLSEIVAEIGISNKSDKLESFTVISLPVQGKWSALVTLRRLLVSDQVRSNFEDYRDAVTPMLRGLAS